MTNVKSPWWHWILRLLVAVLLVQSLFFKFSGADESIFIFTTLGIEPWGRILTGVVELIASVLLFVPRGTAWGAGLAAGTMAGAILGHFTKLGIEVQGDGGQLFAYAVVILLASIWLLWLYRNTILSFLNLNRTK